MSRSFGESYRVGSTSGVHAITVFCSWDYKVTQKWASRLQHDNIRTQLKVGCPGALGPLSPTPCPGNTSQGLLRWERVRAALGPSPRSPRVLRPLRAEACRVPAGTCPSPRNSPGVHERTLPKASGLEGGWPGPRGRFSACLGFPAAGFGSGQLTALTRLMGTQGVPWGSGSARVRLSTGRTAQEAGLGRVRGSGWGRPQPAAPSWGLLVPGGAPEQGERRAVAPGVGGRRPPVLPEPPCVSVCLRGSVPRVTGPLPPPGAAGRGAAEAAPPEGVRTAATGGRAGARLAAVFGDHAGVRPGRLHLLRARDPGAGRAWGSPRRLRPWGQMPASLDWAPCGPAASARALPGGHFPHEPCSHSCSVSTLSLFFCPFVFSSSFGFSFLPPHLCSIRRSPPPTPLPVRFEHGAWGGGWRACHFHPLLPPREPLLRLGPISGPASVLGALTSGPPPAVAEPRVC